LLYGVGLNIIFWW